MQVHLEVNVEKLSPLAGSSKLLDDLAAEVYDGLEEKLEGLPDQVSLNCKEIRVAAENMPTGSTLCHL